MVNVSISYERTLLKCSFCFINCVCSLYGLLNCDKIFSGVRMSSNPYINTKDYNYSGYGDTDIDFDDFEETIKKEAGRNQDVYEVVLEKLAIDKQQMDKILCTLTKSKDNSYTFIRQGFDFRILFFKDLDNHVLACGIKKIYDACKNMRY